MYTGKLVFSQVMELLPLHEFHKCVARYQGHYQVKSFFCLDQFFCMAFAQLTYRESLRDIEVCLNAQASKLYRMGIRGNIARSTLADANEKRDWRIYADFALVLIHEAMRLYQHEEFALELTNTIYALDSSTIDLCLSLFSWAHFQTTKAAVKLHSLLDLKKNVPDFIQISTGKMHDVHILDTLIPEPGSFYLMDRGYIDFARLHLLHQLQVFFVTRAKTNMVWKRRYSYPVEKTLGLRCDQTVVLTASKACNDYPDPLRRIKFFDTETEKELIFLSKNFATPAFNITQLYKCRWQVELQAAPAHQKVFRHFRERGENSNLDCHLGLFAGGHPQKKAESRSKSLHNFTGFELNNFRENTHFTAIGRPSLQITSHHQI